MKTLLLIFLALLLSVGSFAQSSSGCISGNCEDGYGTYVWPADTEWAGDKYIGNWSGGSMSGQGTYYYHSGSKYVGAWSESNFEGYGIFYYYNGDRYEGYWHESNKHGQGTYYYADGTSTSGIFNNGEFPADDIPTESACTSGDCNDGYGTYVWGSSTKWGGDKYVGYWKDGSMHGQGDYFYHSGATYSGAWVNGNFEGYGVYKWDDGQRYEGEWLNSNKHGKGTYYYLDGTTKTGIWVDDKYDHDEVITGCISGDCANGYGTYTWESGEKYEGNWRNDKRNGQGTNYYDSGNVYSGEWLADQQHGYGTMTYAGGDTYSGNYSYHKREGYGTYKFKSGNKYIGEWKNSMYNGQGTLYYADGRVESGLWVDDEYQGASNYNETGTGCISGNCTSGYGVYRWENGDRYEGYWDNNKISGEGTYKFASGEKYTGKWKEGKRHGDGTNTYKPSSTLESYQGSWKDDYRSGQGTLIMRNGDKYIGSFLTDKYDGEGTLYKANGSSQSGYWEAGSYVGASKNNYGCISGNCDNGYGTYTFQTGNKYIGNWVNGNYNGQGTMYFNNGDKYVGNFKDDQFQGQGTYIFAADGRKYVGEWLASTYNGIGTMYFSNGEVKSGLWKDGEYVGQNNQTGSAPKISWLTPVDYETSVSDNQYKIKLCVESETDLTNVVIYVNGVSQGNIASRGFKIVTAACDKTVDEVVKLSAGVNKIQVEVQNSFGKVKSDLRTINYAASSGEKRLALVIGNSTYADNPLKNPENDANTIAQELRACGFDVQLYTNLGQTDMKRYIRSFGEKLAQDKGVGLFYFAGHGIQMDGQNYIVPVDASIEKEQDVDLEAVNLRRVLGEMDYAGNDLNIVILDACRNNPFVRSFRSGGNNGLATTIAPQGTFIAYATAPGSVASDGTGANGLYTEELIQAMRKPSVKIEDVFKQVRNNVYQRSAKQQVPWENSSIFGDFYFKR